MFDVRSILVPVDFSACSKAALEHALSLAERFGAKVVALHVWDIPAYVTPQMMLAVPGSADQSFEEYMLANSKEGMAATLRNVKVPPKVELSSRFIRGETWREITSESERGGFDLVVMGTHGRTGLDRILLGSVAEKVIRHSTRPVLTVRGPKEG